MSLGEAGAGLDDMDVDGDACGSGGSKGMRRLGVGCEEGLELGLGSIHLLIRGCGTTQTRGDSRVSRGKSNNGESKRAEGEEGEESHLGSEG